MRERNHLPVVSGCRASIGTFCIVMLCYIDLVNELQLETKAIIEASQRESGRYLPVDSSRGFRSHAPTWVKYLSRGAFPVR